MVKDTEKAASTALADPPRPARAREAMRAGSARVGAREANDALLARLERPKGFRRTLVLWCVALAALLAIGLLFAMAARADALTPLRERTSDQAIAADLAKLETLSSRLKAAPAADAWRVARADALIGAARTEYLDNDRTGFDVAAYEAAKRAVDEIASGAPAVAPGAVPEGAVIGGSTKVRPDLWDRLEAMKRDPQFACAAEPLARLEVELLWAGNEQVDQGDCHTSPHLAAAERLADDARTKLEACRPAEPVAAIPVTPEPAKPAPTEAVPVPVVPTPEELRIPRNVHFALDKYFLSARSREVIAGISSVLRKYPSITVRLEGHTDSRASAAYNLRLSKNRVNAVQAEMVRLGVAASRITTAFKGEADLKVSEDSKSNFARNRRVEMVFVDPEGQDIQAEDQEEDLQLESDREFRKGLGTRR